MKELRLFQRVVTSVVIATTATIGGFVAKVQAATSTLPISLAVKVTGVDTVRDLYGVDGTGITIGVISDSFDSAPSSLNAEGKPDTYNSDIANGYLPSGIQVLKDYFGPNATDEGRGILELIHAVAPGAGLAFYSVAGSDNVFNYSTGIQALSAAGAKIIVDDRSFLPAVLPNVPGEIPTEIADREPPDGPINQAIDSVVAQGVSYFSSAGNFKTGFPDVGGPSLPIYGHRNNPAALTVGSVYYGRLANVLLREQFEVQQGDLEPFSSAGNPDLPFMKPDVVAPDGLSISFQLCDATQYSCDFNPSNFDSGFYDLFGTSASAPFTAAVAALLLQADPSATPSEIYDALRRTAKPLEGETGFNLESGYGLIEADEAISALGLKPKSVPEPSEALALLCCAVLGNALFLKRTQKKP